MRGAHVVSSVRVCDKGKNHYCALELVVTDPHYASPRDLVLAERNLLRGHGWSGASAQTGDELADESPANKLRMTYATAYGDLHDIEFGSVDRTRQTQEALSKQMFARRDRDVRPAADRLAVERSRGFERRKRA